MYLLCIESCREREGNIINNRLTVSDYNSHYRMQLAISWMDLASSFLLLLLCPRVITLITRTLQFCDGQKIYLFRIYISQNILYQDLIIIV